MIPDIYLDDQKKIVKSYLSDVYNLDFSSLSGIVESRNYFASGFALIPYYGI
jgi:hypothetical protein